jgi:plastocyanin
MRSRKRVLLLASLIGAAMAILPAVAGFASGETVSAMEEAGLYGSKRHYWMPSLVEKVAPGGSVTFQNTSATVPHGIVWTGGPGTPICEKGGVGKEVPVYTAVGQGGETGWKGSCRFSQAGTYTFYCSVHGSEMSGTIKVANGEPTVTTEAASSETEHEATLNGTVNPNGKLTKYFYKWGTTESYGATTSVKSAGEGTEGVSVPETLKGLAPGTLYHYRLVAENAANTAGPTEGADRTFTTVSPPGPPVVTTGLASPVSDTEETLKGTINPSGEATKYIFNYGASTSYGQHSTELTLTAADHTSHAVSIKLEGLTPGTTYHFELVAKNLLGTVPGGDEMFTTMSPSLPPTTTTSTTTTPTPPPTTTTLAEPPPGPPIVGSPSLRSTQRGTSVKGSLEVSQSGAGGRLEVDLLAKGASLAKLRHAGSVRVGRLVRASVSAGKVSFSVALTAAAKRALARKHRLPLTVKIVLTPTRGPAVSIARSVTLRS